MSLRMALVGGALAACVPAAAPPRLSAADIAAIPSAFPTTIVAPHDPALQPLADALAADHPVASAGQIVSILIDLRRVAVPITVEQCGIPAATYFPRGPGAPRIRICYELVADANQRAGKPPDTWDEDTRFLVIFAALHEIAHALMDLAHARADREEDRADQFALLVVTHLDDPALARAAIHGPAAYFARRADAPGAPDPTDPHSASADRAAHAICMLWGRQHDPALAARIGARGPACQADADQARAYWNLLLAPYTRAEGGVTF